MHQIRLRNVVQSNEITESAYSLSRDQKRIIYMCLSQIKFDCGQHDGSFEIKVAEYAELFSVSSHEASRDIKLAIKDLFKRSITFFVPSESTETEIATDEYAWLSKSASRPKKGLYILNINRELMPFMLNLKNKFTKFQLADTEKLTNPYAMRLYESLCQFKAAGVFVAKTSWLIERYQLPQSYNRYPDLKRRFLIPAIEEINSKTSLNTTYIEQKNGRKVEKILFYIFEK